MAVNNWITNFKKLSSACQKRLTIENDDKQSMFSVKELYDMVYQKIGIPIVFDVHHHKFCTGDLSEEEALKLAIKTWPKDIIPVIHYSESKSLHENNPTIRLQAHSDYINEYVNTYDMNVHIMLECKAKDLALVQYRKKYFAE